MTVRIGNVQLISGQTLEVADGLTLIVGPNNVGKSVLLNEILAKLRRGPGQGDVSLLRIVHNVELTKDGDTSAFLEFLKQRYLYRPAGSYSDGYHHEPTIKAPNFHGLTEGEITQIWDFGPDRLGRATDLVVRHLGAEGRAGAVADASSMDLSKDQPVVPLQTLYANRDLEDLMSGYMRRAFGVDLTLNRYAGSVIRAHVGRPDTQETSAPPPRQYREELFALPPLPEQGDGIKAFMGILFSICTSHYPVVMIDEPEAFLHPPQAELLGQILAEHHAQGTQLIVATHSADIVRGVTSANVTAGKVTVARLTRSGTTNHLAQIPSDAVRGLYEDPLIKFYNVLNGLFFQGVVLCEADSDCTYYRAVLSILTDLTDGQLASPVSLHFTHCGGKTRLPRAVSALHASEVPVASVVDFDFLCEIKDFDDLIRAHGGDPVALHPRRNDIVNAIKQKTIKVKRSAARAEISEILDGSDATELSSNEVNKIKAAVAGRSGWKEAKQQGRGCLSGQAVESFDSLDADLRALGIFIVPIGELERFHPELPQENKAEWLRRVLEDNKYRSSDTAAKFVRSMVSYIANRQ